MTYQSYEARLLRVLAYIHDNPAGDLSLDALADVAALSRFHWHRIYTAMMGETCAATVRRIRMHCAGNMLVTTDLPLPEIAARVGYPDTTSFGRAFVALHDTTPTTFRATGMLRTLPTPPQGAEKMFPVEVKETKERNLHGLIHIGAYQEISKTYGRLEKLINDHKLHKFIGGMYAVYLNDPETTKPADLRSFAGFEFSTPDLPDALGALALPAGRAAVLTFKGPYAGLADAYQYLFGNWLPASGETPADAPAYEYYINTPANTAPADLRTEIHLPLRGT